MTTRERYLVLRLAAAVLADEPYSVAALRRTLTDLGWTAAALDAAVAKARASVEAE